MESSKIVRRDSTSPIPAGGSQDWRLAFLKHFGPACLAGEACARLLVQVLNPRGVHCLSCGCPVPIGDYPLPPRRIRCTHCGRRFTAFSNTVLEGCKLSLAQVTLVCLLLALGQDNATVASLADVSAETARAWRAKLGAA